MTTKAELPARDLAQIKLAQHLTAEGCPLCSVRATAGRHYLRTLIYEAVNDRDMRAALDKSRGYCRRHALALRDEDRRQTGDTVGAGTLFAAILRQRLQELADLPAAKGRRLERDLEVASAPASCPVCRHERSAHDSAMGDLIRLMADDAWARAAGEASFCLDDLLSVMRAIASAGPPQRERMGPVSQSQIRRIAGLAGDLEDLAHNSSYDRRGAITPSQASSPDRAADLLGGTEARPIKSKGGTR